MIEKVVCHAAAGRICGGTVMNMRRRRRIMRMMNNMMTRSMRIDEGCSG
jgi:hypothetical protein